VKVKASVWTVIRDGLAARAGRPLSRLIGVDEHNVGEYIEKLSGALD
jgi:hypothetical protein